GEYDILILSARESSGLETWLRDNGYRIPTGATAILGSYIKQNMKFFVAKVNLQEQSKLGFSYLRPLQVAYASPKFMLPIRLGTVNSAGPKELFVYALTRRGRVETTNYRTVRLPSDAELPLFVREEFPRFYRDMFARQVKKEDMRAVFLEYAWDMGWCDPCAAEPLTSDELRQLGVFWVEATPGGPFIPGPRGRRFPGGAVDVFVTRLHVRYDAGHFPEDLDRGSVELPGALYPAPPLEGRGSLRGRHAIRRGAAPTRRSRGRKLGRAHRLVDRRDPREDARRIWRPARRSAEVVAAPVGRLRASPTLCSRSWPTCRGAPPCG